ncbi:MAG: hypothetical protein V3T23_02820 [Nitrososphaerales archaeon]
MQKNVFAIIATLFFLFSCSRDDSNPNKNLRTNINIASDSDIVINVDIASELKNDIKINYAQGKKPGDTNPVESTITVTNETNSRKEILVKGNWYDSRGNGYGGNSNVLTLAPHQSQTLKAGTRSTNVTAYKLSLAPNTKTQEELLTDALSNTSRKIAEGYGMTYSETATDEFIPALPIRGFANGEAFQGRTVAFAQGTAGKWRLEISDHVFDVLKGVGYARYEQNDLQTIYINLPQEPAVGDKLGKDMSYGGGYFQIKTSPSSSETTSWNTSIAYAIEIGSWNKETSVDGPCGNPDLGTASGKLYISFKGSEQGLTNSWVSGEFKDVPIIYCGMM